MVLNANAKREQGKVTQRANIQAAKAVSDIVRTTLGPKSMLKMLLDPMGGIVLTNDGNAILREVSQVSLHFCMLPESSRINQISSQILNQCAAFLRLMSPTLLQSL